MATAQALLAKASNREMKRASSGTYRCAAGPAGRASSAAKAPAGFCGKAPALAGCQRRPPPLAELAKGHQPAGTRAGVKRQAQGLQGMAKRQASGEQAKLPLVAMRVQARLAKCQFKPAYQAHTLASRKC